MRDIKFRYRLKLVSDDWGDYREGDEATFYFNLNNKYNGLYRFSIDERWDIVSCDQWTGLKDINEDDIYENDILKVSVAYNCDYEYKIPEHVRNHSLKDVEIKVSFSDGCFILDSDYINCTKQHLRLWENLEIVKNN